MRRRERGGAEAEPLGALRDEFGGGLWPPSQRKREAAPLGALRDEISSLTSRLRDLQVRIERELDRALAARTPWEVYRDELAERVLPLSRKDTGRGERLRRAALERRQARLLREAQALGEESARLQHLARRLHDRSENWSEQSRRLAVWSSALLAHQQRLAAWTRQVLEVQQRRLEALEAGFLATRHRDLP
jgi:hypothetical protein